MLTMERGRRPTYSGVTSVGRREGRRPAKCITTALVAVSLAVATLASAKDSIITGTDGDDVINGTPAADSIYARAGNDTVNGGAGNDELDGGAGGDRLSGGPGRDAVSYSGTA